jgi:hypothetical protein
VVAIWRAQGRDDDRLDPFPSATGESGSDPWHVDTGAHGEGGIAADRGQAALHRLVPDGRSLAAGAHAVLADPEAGPSVGQ